MTFFQAVILGLVQGLTEFFPISSSAHLRLAKWFLGIQGGENLVYFDLICHAGTMVALLIFLRRDVWAILTNWRKMALYALALAPLVPAYFFLKPLRLAASDPAYLGYCLMLTGGILFTASKKKETLADVSKPKLSNMVFIGLAQTLALIPGISRSGSTISMARFCGWSWLEAARFSFLLSIPTILGGEILETIKLLGGHSEAMGAVSSACYAGGFAASLGLGLLAVRCVFWIYEKGSVRPFAWYCLAAGLFTWAIYG